MSDTGVQPVGQEAQPPVVSVVMSVFNGASALPRTLEGLSLQQGVAFETVIVNDGSTDGTAELLDRWCSGAPGRHVLHQDNQGLTAALVVGCGAVRGRYIARQDAGDVSLPGRLARQAAMLDADPEVVLISAGTHFMDDEGELLYEVVMDDAAVTASLTAEDPRDLRGPPHHGSTMFRRDAYLAAGGYRTAFRVAQDLDLWIRLVEEGRVASLPEVLYRADSSPGAISFNRRHLQQEATRLIAAARDCRRRGESEKAVLDEARRVTSQPARGGRQSAADYHYFIAGCQRRNRPESAMRNYRRALAANPLYWRAALRWLQCRLGRFNRPSPAK